MGDGFPPNPNSNCGAVQFALTVPTVADRALQRSVSQVLSAIYEQDFLPCSFGGRAGRGAHQALATLHERIAGGKIEWVLEADLKNFFGSLSHEWMLRFVEHRVGDQRMISLIRRWLKAGVLEKGEVHLNEEGTPQGGSITPRTQKITSNLSVPWGTAGDASLPLDLCHIWLYSNVVCPAPAQPRRLNV